MITLDGEDPDNINSLDPSTEQFNDALADFNMQLCYGCKPRTLEYLFFPFESQLVAASASAITGSMTQAAESANAGISSGECCALYSFLQLYTTYYYILLPNRCRIIVTTRTTQIKPVVYCMHRIFSSNIIYILLYTHILHAHSLLLCRFI